MAWRRGAWGGRAAHVRALVAAGRPSACGGRTTAETGGGSRRVAITDAAGGPGISSAASRGHGPPARPGQLSLRARQGWGGTPHALSYDPPCTDVRAPIACLACDASLCSAASACACAWDGPPSMCHVCPHLLLLQPAALPSLLVAQICFVFSD